MALFAHVGIIVKDIEETTKLWSKVLEPLGIGPWEFQDIITAKEDMEVCEPLRVRIAIAPINKLGSVKLEVLEPIGEKSPIYSKFLENHGEGWHHIAFVVSNFDEITRAFEKNGGRVLFRVNMGGKRNTYIETKPEGAVFEFMEA